jgi:hypothetical protein
MKDVPNGKRKRFIKHTVWLRIILLIDDSYWLQGSMKEKKNYQTTKECFLDCHAHIFKKVSAFLGIRQIFRVNVMARY